MVIKGIINKIVFRNSENGYSVIILDGGIGLGSITAVGVVPELTEGSSVELTGDFIVNSKFGEQFTIRGLKICLPNTLESIAKYLSSGLFKGVGEVMADAIVNKFGKDTFEIIKTTPLALADIRGISAKKAMEINQVFMTLQDMQEVILYLQGLDISLNMALRIYKVYGQATRSMMEQNPYQMVDDIDGIGFYTADKIAKSLGISCKSDFRIQASVGYILTNIASNNGHTYLPMSQLYQEAVKLLELDQEEVWEIFQESILTLEVLGRVVVLDNDGDKLVMAYKHFDMEKRIASKIVSLYSKAANISADIDADIAEYERVNGIELHQNQRQAIINGVAHGVNIITGGPGTGKTTIIKAILSIFQSLSLKVQLCAPTGRAAKRLSESTNCDAKTIHRLLDLDFKDGKGFFAYNENTQLDCDVVIIDEVSMCDEYVFSSLIGAIPRGGRLIMVGDKDQLPSVGAGNVLADIISNGLIPVSYLTQIFRQSDNSLIVANAHRINNGEMPLIRNSDSDFMYINQSDATLVKDTVVELVASRIPNYYKIPTSDIQVLAPLKKGVAGADNLNIALQAALNPPRTERKEVKYGEIIFREGDKIIHIINDYDLKWKKGEEEGQGVFNGDIGYIISITTDRSLVIEFEDGRVSKYPSEIWDKIKLAYAVSVHKSQGSEFKVVVIALSAGSYTILTRNLLYTAVTRAKSVSVIVGGMDNLRRMVANNYTAKRYTLLDEFITEESSRQGVDE